MLLVQPDIGIRNEEELHACNASASAIRGGKLQPGSAVACEGDALECEEVLCLRIT